MVAHGNRPRLCEQHTQSARPCSRRWRYLNCRRCNFCTLSKAASGIYDKGLTPLLRRTGNLLPPCCGALQQLTVKICGFQQHETLNYARKLGTAIQLSHILRNIHRDTRVGKSTRPRMRCRNRVFHKKTSFNRATAITCRACWRLCRAGLEATAGTGSRQAAIQPVSCAQFIALLKKRRKNNDRTLNQQLNEQISLSPLHKLRSAWRTQSRANSRAPLKPRRKTTQ